MQVIVSVPLQSWSTPSSAVSGAPGYVAAPASLQSSEVADSISAVSQVPSGARVAVPASVPKPSWSASTMQVMVSVPLQSWSMPSSGTSVPEGFAVGSASSQSSDVVDSPWAVSQLPSSAGVVVPRAVPKPSWSASTMQVMVSDPLQSWSVPSSGVSVAPGKMPASASLQSSVVGLETHSVPAPSGSVQVTCVSALFVKPSPSAS